MMIKRRTFALAATALVAGSRIVRADAEFSYKIGTSTPAAHPFNTRLKEVGDLIARDHHAAPAKLLAAVDHHREHDPHLDR